jgi:hypothetical protein
MTKKEPTRYLFLHRSEVRDAGERQMQGSPEEMQAMFARWNAWKEKFKDNIVDWGDKLKAGGKVVGQGGVSDGPFVEAKEVIGGFMIVATDTLEQAIAVAREMPLMDPHARIEIRELIGASVNESRQQQAKR